MTVPIILITFSLDKIMLMIKSDLELRIKELELELSNLKSDDAVTKSTAKSIPEESDVKFMAIANYLPAYIAYIDADTLQYEFVNDLYEKSFGISREKIIGSHLRDVIGETSFQFALKYINEVKSGKSDDYYRKLTLEIVSLHLKESKMIEEYSNKFLAILPAEKVVKMYRSERKFRSYLMHEMRKNDEDKAEKK